MFEVSKLRQLGKGIIFNFNPPRKFCLLNGFWRLVQRTSIAALISQSGGIIFKIQPVKWKVGNQPSWIEEVRVLL